MDREQLGKLITALRLKKGLNQKELAALLFISPSTVSKWETGINQPDASMLSAMTELLEVSGDDLLHPDQALLKLEQQDENEELLASVEKEQASLKNLKFMNKMLSISLVSVAVLLLFIVIGTYRYFHPDFTIVDTRYYYNVNHGNTYEIAVLCPENASRDAMDAFTETLMKDWKNGKIQIQSDASAIDICFYYDETKAREWSTPENEIFLVKYLLRKNIIQF